MEPGLDWTGLEHVNPRQTHNPCWLSHLQNDPSNNWFYLSQVAATVTIPKPAHLHSVLVWWCMFDLLCFRDSICHGFKASLPATSLSCLCFRESRVYLFFTIIMEAIQRPALWKRQRLLLIRFTTECILPGQLQFITIFLATYGRSELRTVDCSNVYGFRILHQEQESPS